MTRDEEERLFITIDNMEKELMLHRYILMQIAKDCKPDYFMDYFVNLVADMQGDDLERIRHPEG